MNTYTLENTANNKDSFIISEENKKVIDRNWETLNIFRKDLFNSTLLRVVSVDNIPIKEFLPEGNHMYNTQNTTLQVCNDIDYKVVVSLRYLDGENNRKVDKNDLFYSLSSYIFVKTIDRKVVAINRNSGDWIEALDMPGGFIRAEYHIADAKYFAIQRACSDLDIQTQHIINTNALGMYKNDSILELVLIYQVDITLTFDELSQLYGKKIYALTEVYSTDNHHSFFDVKIHPPLKPIMDYFFKKVFEGGVSQNTHVISPEKEILPFSRG